MAVADWSIWQDQYKPVMIEWPEWIDEVPDFFASKHVPTGVQWSADMSNGALRMETQAQRAFYRRGQRFEVDHYKPVYYDNYVVPTIDTRTVDCWILEVVQDKPVQPMQQQGPSHATLARRLAQIIPGISDLVEMPCECHGERSIWSAIQHLNDTHHPDVVGDPDHGWSRERIADWLDTLDADLMLDPDNPREPTAPKQPALKPGPGPSTSAWKQMMAYFDEISTFSEKVTSSFEKLIAKVPEWCETHPESMVLTTKQWQHLNASLIKSEDKVSKILVEINVDASQLMEELTKWGPPEQKKHEACTCIVCRYNKEES